MNNNAHKWSSWFNGPRLSITVTASDISNASAASDQLNKSYKPIQILHSNPNTYSGNKTQIFSRYTNTTY